MFDTNFIKIQYIAVEVIKKNSTKVSDVECGLLMGICTKKNVTDDELKFLVLAIRKESVRLYNLNEFNILTVDILDNNIRYMTVFTNTKEDQKSSINMIKEITNQLEKDGKLQENDINNELINIETYTDYPEVILTANNISEKIIDDNTTVNNTNTNTTVNNDITTVKYIKTEPTVLNFKRKGALPSIKKLELMKNKVVKLASGQFKLKKLHIPICDLKENDEEKKTSSAIT